MQDEYYHHYQIVNINNTEKQIEGLEFFFVELPKFKPQNRAEKKLHELWLRFLTEINEKTKEIPQEMLDNDELREAVSYVERGAYTKEQLEAYDKWKIDTLTARSMLSAAEAKGEARGEARGEAKGEANTHKKVIANAILAGYSLDVIATITGLTLEEVMKIMEG